jgi:uncharacterized protein (DUF2249 family)
MRTPQLIRVMRSRRFMMSELALASSIADAEAVEDIQQHDAELGGALDARVSGLIDAARSGGDVDAARADLVSWCEQRLLTHLKAQESAVYPAGRSLAEARLLVDAMRAEHDVIARLVGELRTAALPVHAAARAAALQVVVEGHLAKADNQLVPALAAAPEVGLADLLAGVREILGVEVTRATAEVDGHAGGTCTCGEHEAPGFPELDARVVPHAIRHATIFGALDAVHPGRGMVLVAPHDPLPLLAQIEAREPGAFEISYLQRGPEAWRLPFLRRAS